jgi:hypothetical protein
VKVLENVSGGILSRRFWKNKGQTTVELLLMLPVFFLLLFSIMEIGNIAFQYIVANHGAYELARIGSLTAGPPRGNLGFAIMKMNNAKMTMFPTPGDVTLSVATEITGSNPQGIDHINADLILTLNYKANLVFPISRYLLSRPFGSGKLPLTVILRMPIENPPK